MANETATFLLTRPCFPFFRFLVQETKNKHKYNQQLTKQVTNWFHFIIFCVFPTIFSLSLLLFFLVLITLDLKFLLNSVLQKIYRYLIDAKNWSTDFECEKNQKLKTFFFGLFKINSFILFRILFNKTFLYKYEKYFWLINCENVFRENRERGISQSKRIIAGKN